MLKRVVISETETATLFLLKKLPKCYISILKAHKGGCNMNREQEIREAIWKHEQENEKRKRKLVMKTWAVVSAVFYISAFFFRWMQGPLEFLIGIVLSVVASGIFMVISTLVLTPLLIFREHEVTTLTRLRTELDLIEKGQ